VAALGKGLARFAGPSSHSAVRLKKKRKGRFGGTNGEAGPHPRTGVRARRPGGTGEKKKRKHGKPTRSLPDLAGLKEKKKKDLRFVTSQGELLEADATLTVGTPHKAGKKKKKRKKEWRPRKSLRTLLPCL